MSSIRVYLDTAGSPTHFPAPTWTEVTSLLLADGGVTFSDGVASRGQDWAAGSFTLTLRNTAGTYTGPTLLRRPVLLRMAVGASNIDVRAVITDVVEYRDGVRRLVVTGTDVLGLAADLEVGRTWDEQLATAGATSRWQLVTDGADTGPGAIDQRPLSEDPWAGAPVAAGQDYSGQSPVYGAIEGCPALSGGGVTLEPVGTTGFRGLYSTVEAKAPWTWAAWCLIPEYGFQSGADYATVVEVLTSAGRYIPVQYSARLPGKASLLGTAWGSWPWGQWVWVTLGVDDSNVASFAITDALGTTLTESTPILTLAAGEVPMAITIGGSSDPASSPLPATVQIADAVWCNATPATATPLIRGHVGYPKETVQARALRLLTAAGLVPAAGAWNGATPPEGPPLSDQPWTRRPLTDALNETLTSGGFVVHDLPASSASVTTLGLLWPDAIDGYGATVTSYAGTRVLLASDGVTTNTGMLTNAATVINSATQAQVSYEDTASVATYGRRAKSVASLSLDADHNASLASWLARREAAATQALGLPDLILDVDGMVADGLTSTVVAMARTGACVSIANLLPGGGTYTGVVRGLQWQQTPQGAMRLTLRCQPLRPLAYALLDDTATATLDDVILGWAWTSPIVVPYPGTGTYPAEDLYPSVDLYPED